MTGPPAETRNGASLAAEQYDALVRDAMRWRHLQNNPRVQAALRHLRGEPDTHDPSFEPGEAVVLLCQAVGDLEAGA